MDPRKTAVEIARFRRARLALPTLAPGLRPETLDEAYRAQGCLHEELQPELGPRTGYKIGCTTPVMRDYLGIPSPCAGGVFSRSTLESGVELDPAAYVRVGIECEIAVRLGRDLAPRGAPFRAQEVATAVEAYHPAIEIVEDRYADWRTIGTPTLIADDFFAAGCVLGAAVPPEAAPRLEEALGRILVDGEEAGRGHGADVMGHPHEALAWLANDLSARGPYLRQGEIVLTGSLVRTVWLVPGNRAVATISGLGEVGLSLGQA
jgi:2-keto-4-pentenoate hydratase